MDIQMCTGEKCEMKQKCKRFKGKWNEYMQPIFTQPPFVINNGKQFCPHFKEFNLKDNNEKAPLI